MTPGAEIPRRQFLLSAGALAAGAAVGTPTVRAAKRSIPRPNGTLQQAMRGHVFTRRTPGFTAAAHVYNERFDHVVPSAVGRPINAADVAAAVRWAVGHGVPLRARSGGHSYAGYSTVKGGVVLDLRRLNRITVNRRAGTATIGAGAQLIDVYAGLARRGAALPAGSCPSVGIAGVTLGGGMGLSARAFGLTCDNLVAAQIVTADGRIRTVDRRHNPDLLWALRGGGGGNFGIVTQFTFRVHPLPRAASYFFVSWPWSQASAALAAWQAWAPHAPDALTSIFHLNAGVGTSVSVSGQYLGPVGGLDSLLGPLRSVPGARIATGQKSFLSLQVLFAGCEQIGFRACHTTGTAPGGKLPRESFQAKSDYIARPLPAAARDALVAATEVRARQPGSGALLFDAYGGAINRVAPHATAFVHRQELCCLQYLSYNGGAGWLNQTHARMRPYVSGQAYQNYIDPGLAGWQGAYYGSNLARLEHVRREFDPHHRFNFPQAIGR